MSLYNMGCDMWTFIIFFAQMSSTPEEASIFMQWSNHYPKKVCEKCWRDCHKFCEQYTQELDGWCKATGKMPGWYIAWKCDSYALKRIWYLADDVIRVETLSWPDRVARMHEIRKLMGDTRYLSGVLPPVFPIGYPKIPNVVYNP